MNEHERYFWNTEISDSLLDSQAAAGLEWLKYWPTSDELLIAVSQGNMFCFVESTGMKAHQAMDGEAR